MKQLLKGTGKILFLAVPALLASCGDTEKPEENIVADTTAVETNVEVQKDFYQVPAPNEMFVFIKQAGGGKKNAALLHDPQMFNQYNDLSKKALNFGIYSTDLLFCSTFDLGSEIMNYFAVVKKMGDDLGVSSAISEDDTRKIDNSIGNNDSLVAVANDIYYKTYQTLEENDQGKVLAQMVAGGWIESLYLVTQMNPEYKEGSEVIQRVADQKLTLENLISYLEKYQDDPGVSGTIAQLRTLQSDYAGLSTTDKGQTTVKEKNGRRVLGGGQEITMTAEQYGQIKSRIAEIRQNITGKSA